MTDKPPKVLVLGASGYVGSRLVGELLNRGYLVRAAARSSKKFNRFAWSQHPQVESYDVDILEIDKLRNACKGCEYVFYLVHSMNGEHKDFVETDRRAAENMASAAAATEVKRIIYLGGLGDEQQNLSRHLRSRQEVSVILHSGQVPTTTFRAAMIIGGGSTSFEILSTLVDRAPVMFIPRWLKTESQPIAVKNVISYLANSLNVKETMGQNFDIGGPDILSYRDLIDIYTQERGISRRAVIPIPLLTPVLSAYWIQLVTGFPSYIARPLAEGLKNRMVCQENRIRELIVQPLIDCRSAIREAIRERERKNASKN